MLEADDDTQWLPDTMSVTLEYHLYRQWHPGRRSTAERVILGGSIVRMVDFHRDGTVSGKRGSRGTPTPAHAGSNEPVDRDSLTGPLPGRCGRHRFPLCRNGAPIQNAIADTQTRTVCMQPKGSVMDRNDHCLS